MRKAPVPVTTPRHSKRLLRSLEESPSPSPSPRKRKRITEHEKKATVAQVAQERSIVPEERPLNNEHEQMPPLPKRPPIKRRVRGPISIHVESPSRWRRKRKDRPPADLTGVAPMSALRAAMQVVAAQGDPKEIIALILAGVQPDDSDINAIVRGAQDKAPVTIPQHSKRLRRSQEESPFHSISIESGRANLTAIDNTLERTVEPIAEQSIQVQEISAIAIQAELNALQIDASPRFSNMSRGDEKEIHVSNVSPPRVYASTSKPKDKEINFETAMTSQVNLLHRIRALFLENGNSTIQLEQLCDILTRPKIASTFFYLLYLESKQYIRMEYVPETIELGNIYPGEKLHSN